MVLGFILTGAKIGLGLGLVALGGCVTVSTIKPIFGKKEKKHEEITDSCDGHDYCDIDTNDGGEE